jgi:hypothetical protein
MNSWQEHGNAFQRIIDRVIYIKVMGGFNREGAEANSAKIQQKVNAHFNDDRPWANYHDLTHFELGTPDLKEVADKHYVWSIESGMTHEAILAPNMMAREMMQMMLEPYTKDIHFAYFDSMKDGLDWLVKVGFLKQESIGILTSLQHVVDPNLDTKSPGKPLL